VNDIIAAMFLGYQQLLNLHTMHHTEATLQTTYSITYSAHYSHFSVPFFHWLSHSIERQLMHHCKKTKKLAEFRVYDNIPEKVPYWIYPNSPITQYRKC